MTIAPKPAPAHALFLGCDIVTAPGGGRGGAWPPPGQAPEVTSQLSHLLPVAGQVS